MELVQEFTMSAELAAPLNVGGGPYGTRIVFPVTAGAVAGERITGRLVGGGGDWLLLGADGWGRLDVRAHIETDDGAVIYGYYGGLLEFNGAVMQASQSAEGETGFDDQYFRTTPRFETGHDGYQWLNQAVFVARGRLTAGGVAYEVFRVT